MICSRFNFGKLHLIRFVWSFLCLAVWCEAFPMSAPTSDHKKELVPYLLVTLFTADVKVICESLQSRGFLPLYYLDSGKSSTILLDISPKLFTKVLLILGLPITSISRATNLTRTRVSFHARKTLLRSGIDFHSIWVVHQPDQVACCSFIYIILSINRLIKSLMKIQER
jgi:hypothetical protein